MSPATAARSAGSAVRGARPAARAGAATAHPRAPTRPAGTAPRRISGPARAHAGAYAPVSPPDPFRLRLAPALARIPDHRFLDRVVRGRLWIGCIAFALLGIVAMQLSLLKLNTGIGRALEHESLLRRQNATLRYDVSNLSGGNRVETQAVRMGMTMASPGAIHFLSAGGSDQARRAARSLDASPPASPSSGSGTSASAGSTSAASTGSPASAGATSNASTGLSTSASTASGSASGPTISGPSGASGPTVSGPSGASGPTVSGPSGGSGAAPSSGPPPSSGAGASSGASAGAGG